MARSSIDISAFSGSLTPQQLADSILDLNDSAQRHLRSLLLLSVYDDQPGGVRVEAVSDRRHVDVFLPQVSLNASAPVLHSHDYFELMAVLRGSIDIRIENRVCHYETGDFCLPNQNIHHAEIRRNDARIAYICLTQRYLAQWPMGDLGQLGGAELRKFYQLNQLACRTKDYLDFRLLAGAEPALPLVGQLQQEIFAGAPGHELIQYGLLERLVGALSDTRRYRCECQVLDVSRSDAIADDLKSFIESHRGIYTREALEKALHYNRDYLNRILKDSVGLTIGEYSSLVRMRESARLLISTQKTIDEVAEAVGFGNRSQFYRQFDRFYGVTPSAYRAKARSLLLQRK